MKLSFCTEHSRLFRTYGITKTLNDNPKIRIVIRNNDEYQKTCSKIHCDEKAKYIIEYYEGKQEWE